MAHQSAADIYRICLREIKSEILEADSDITEYFATVERYSPGDIPNLREEIYQACFQAMQSAASFGSINENQYLCVKKYVPDKLPVFKEEITKAFVVELRDAIRNWTSYRATAALDILETYGNFPGGRDLRTKLDENFAKYNDSERTVREANLEQSQLNLIDNTDDYIYVSGYIVGETAPNQYEYTELDYNYYLGEIPSDRRRLLFTTDTSFSTKGKFTLRVRFSGNQKVQLKEEYGSFTQSWPTYTEVGDYEAEMIDQAKATLAANWARYNVLTQEIAQARQQMNSILKKSYTVAGETIRPQVDD